MADELFNLQGTIGLDSKPLDTALESTEQKVKRHQEKLNVLLAGFKVERLSARSDAMDVSRQEAFFRNIKQLQDTGKSIASNSVLGRSDGGGGSGDLTGMAIKAGVAVGGVTAAFTLASSAVRVFRGDTGTAIEMMERLPFGVGRAIGSIREFAAVLDEPKTRLKELTVLMLDLVEKAERFRIGGAVEFGEPLEKNAATLELEKRAIFDRQAAQLKAAGIDPFKQGLTQAESATRALIAEQTMKEIERAEMRKQSADLEFRLSKQAADYRAAIDKQSIVEENKRKRLEADGPEFQFARIQAAKLNELLIDEGAEMAKKELDAIAAQALRRDIEDQRIENEANAEFFGVAAAATGGGGREFNARMFAGGVTAGANEQPKAKQIDKTNALLSEIIRKVGVQAAINVVAQ